MSIHTKNPVYICMCTHIEKYIYSLYDLPRLQKQAISIIDYASTPNKRKSTQPHPYQTKLIRTMLSETSIYI